MAPVRFDGPFRGMLQHAVGYWLKTCACGTAYAPPCHNHTARSS